MEVNAGTEGVFDVLVSRREGCGGRVLTGFSFFLLRLCCPLVENVNFCECSQNCDCFISLLQS